MPPFTFEMDESGDAMVPPARLKVALLNAAFDVRAKILDVSRGTGNIQITFDKDVPQSLITDKLAAMMGAPTT